jgi:2'-hydroxyisoflavone reductase
MRILVLGGTVFLGRFLVEAALNRGHEITLFNRGQHNPDLFPQIEKLRGDRSEDLSALHGRRWQATIDTCGFVPRVVAASARLLSGAIDHYTFISTLSVYAEDAPAGANEHAPTGTLADGSVEEITAETYGPLKALCEQAAEAAMPGRVLAIRPGLIVGPFDPSDRFTYWPRRIARGGEVLAPGRPERRVQFIDVRDLADWVIRLVESGNTGIYNATGPDYPLSMGKTLEACREETGAAAKFTWVEDEFLLKQQVIPYTEIPLWVPESMTPSFDKFDCSKAFAAGLAIRPLADTIRDTLAWDASRPAGTIHSSGLAPEREARLLEAWHEGR